MIQKFYSDNGYVILDLYKNKEFLKIKKFTEDWIKSVVQYGTSKNIQNKNIEKYHLWSKELKINHKKIFINPNRVIEPNQKIKNFIFTFGSTNFDFPLRKGIFFLCEPGNN